MSHSRLVALSLMMTLVVTGFWALNSRIARAGARPLEVTLVDMAPVANDASRACVAALARPFRAGGEEYATLRRVSREILLRRMDLSADVDLSAVPADGLHGLRGRGLDAWVLVDCRPEERRLDALVFAGTGTEDLAREGHRTRLSLRDVELTPSLLRGIAESVDSAAWVGFSP